MRKEAFDAIVIGAGQGGDPLARAFAQSGKRTALIERAAVGGTCVNYGCTPTKTLVHIAKVANTVRRSEEYGVHSSAPEMDMLKVRELKRAIVADFRDGTEAKIKKVANLELIYGHARFTSPKTVTVGPRTLQAETICVNTGTRPLIPPVEGLDKVPYLDNASIMELDRVPDSLLIMGGGYIGLEFGQMYARFGSRVTIFEHGTRFLPREDRDVADEVLKILREDGIDIRLGYNVKRVSHDGARLHLGAETANGKERFEGTDLLVAVGRRPNTDDLGIELAGIEVDEHGYIKTDPKLKTTAPGIFALGDVKGGPAFTHISYDDFRLLKENLIDGGDRKITGRPIPYCMFTDPQLGRVGLSEEEAKKNGIDCKVCKMPMANVARALEMNESRGFIKALVDPGTDKILGAAVLGVEGGEVMSMIELAMLGGLTATDLRNGILAHPTLSELLNNLFM
ncbi:mercuric reductase [Fimbriimonas ginsengisoli]|uniref:FAD-dependent pyridine nucleotide-disulfide oxidoreductase n=1 Tax=Fimbriimonas ginsengisoli Gsoil 348 TaxID=661478 RepID=A0A068NTQ2_FIMGI|nr:mercuric reductase [Fimbriimonas ginsengisoli]AIE86120.1 FAD-dependent pyridine nucleotide-disulfide oxidoreductase [Fimbriimonas ginsengisoli Gsoil 348]